MTKKRFIIKLIFVITFGVLLTTMFILAGKSNAYIAGVLCAYIPVSSYQSTIKQNIVRSNAWLKKEMSNAAKQANRQCPYDYLVNTAIEKGILKRMGNKLISSL